jgi:hypothetical protein
VTDVADFRYEIGLFSKSGVTIRDNDLQTVRLQSVCSPTASASGGSGS